MSVDGPSSNRINRAPDAYLNILAETQRRHRLLAVHWEITYRCNERCSHCYLDVLPPGAAPVGELTTEECFRVLDELAAEGALNISFSGGEIFVRKDWHAILAHARKRGFAIRIFTNATLITPQIADQIRNLHPFMVEVSLYAVDAETHDRITRLPGSFEKTLRGVKLLRERNVKVTLKTPLMRENVHQFHAFEEFARAHGAIWHFDPTLTPRDNGLTGNLGHRLTEEQLAWLYRETFTAESFVFAPGDANARTCGITQNSLALDPYGEVFPCVQVRTSAGNVRQAPIHSLWNQARVWGDLGNLTLGELPVCSTCDLRTFCTRCHGLAQMEAGDIRAPAMANCREALVRRRVLIEKGILPADYPVPPHLQKFEFGVQEEPNFIPIGSLEKRTPSHAFDQSIS